MNKIYNKPNNVDEILGVNESRYYLLRFMLGIILPVYGIMAIYSFFIPNIIAIIYGLLIFSFNAFLFFTLNKDSKRLYLYANLMLILNSIFYFIEGIFWGYDTYSMYKFLISIICAIVLDYHKKVYAAYFSLLFVITIVFNRYYTPLQPYNELKFFVPAFGFFIALYVYLLISTFNKYNDKTKIKLYNQNKELEIYLKIFDEMNSGVLILNNNNIFYKNPYYIQHLEDKINISDLLSQTLSDRNIEITFKDQYFSIKQVGLKTDTDYQALIFENITENIHYQNLLKDANIKLEEENNNKSVFISLLAHDLKNPFNVLLNYTELLKFNLENINTDTKSLKLLENIREVINTTFRYFTSILNWIRVNSGKDTLNFSNVCIKNIIDDAVALNAHIAHQKNIDIIQDIGDYNISTDYTILQTTLNNILNNAIKYSNRDSKVEISTKQIDTFNLDQADIKYSNKNTLDQNKILEISIKDYGVGIEKENLEKIFKVSKTFSTLGTENEKGTGFGLLICHEYIRRLGGNLSIYSEKDKYTTVKILLPLNN